METTQPKELFTWLMYDIPTQKTFNPCPLLWRLGIRNQNSVWIIPDRNIPRVPVKAWKERGAKVTIVRIREDEYDVVMEICRESLVTAILEVRESLETGIGKVKEKYEGVASGDYEAAKHVHGYATRYIRTAKTFLLAAQESAVTFNLLGKSQELFDGLRATIAANDQLFYAMYNQKRTGMVPMPAPVATPAETAATDIINEQAQKGAPL